MSITDQQFVCTRPWEWFEIHRRGLVFLCCPTWLKRPAGNLLEQSVADIWNGPVARELRKSTANGSFHNCSRKRCPFLVAGQSPVQSWQTVEDPALRSALGNATGRVPFSPRRLNLCFDHSCSLACPSCRPRHLTLDRGEQAEIVKITHIVREHLLPTATEVTMSGFGDPFSSVAYLDLLTDLDNQGTTGATLRLHSNGQLWTRALWNRFPNLHRRVGAAEISVDAATPETYQHNRPGGSFSILLRNLDYLADQPFPLTLSMVVQNNNFEEIPRFIELARTRQARVYLSQLVNWGTFSRKEFLQRAIHLPHHPRHASLVAVLKLVAPDPDIDIGNLGHLLS